jgi:hypothetical protein
MKVFIFLFLIQLTIFSCSRNEQEFPKVEKTECPPGTIYINGQCAYHGDHQDGGK